MLLACLMTTPAVAGQLWRSNLVCDVGNTGSLSELSPQAFAVLQSPRDLYVSNMYGLTPNTAMTCVLSCFVVGPVATVSCGTTNFVPKGRC